MKVKFLKKDQEKNWEKFVLTYENSNFSHSLAVRDIVKKTYGFKDKYLTCVNKQEEILGLLPLFKVNKNKLVSLPFMDESGALNSNHQVMEEFKKYLNQWLADKNLNIELRQSQQIDSFAQTPNTDNVSSVISLEPDPLRLWKKISKKARNQARKAEKYNPEFGYGGRYLDDFYELYLKSMKTHGTPAHSKKFFNAFLKEWPKVNIFVAKYQGKTVASMFVVEFKKIAYDVWAASNLKYKNLNFNNYLYWQVISYYCQKGFEKFDLGRSQKDSPVLHFKEQWGSQTTPLYYYQLSKEEKKFKSPQKSYLKYLAKTYSLLPLFITKSLGPRLRKYLP